MNPLSGPLTHRQVLRLGLLVPLLLLCPPVLAQVGAPQWFTPSTPSGLAELNLNERVYCATEFDDGSGPKLILGGTFTEVAGQPASLVARFDGESWDNMGGGVDVSGGGESAGVWDLQAFDDGSGPRLFAAGILQDIDRPYWSGVAVWSGGAWQPVEFNFDGPLHTYGVAYALEVYDLLDGQGPRLFAGGKSNMGGGRPVLSVYENGGFTALPGLNPAPGVGWQGFGFLRVVGHDDGSGPALYLGGSFELAGPNGELIAYLARYANGVLMQPPTALQSIDYGWIDLLRADFGHGPELVVSYTNPPQPYIQAKILRWDGTNSHSLGKFGPGEIGAYRIGMFDAEDGLGECLVAAGSFSTVDGKPARNLARLHDTGWLPMLGAGAWNQAIAFYPYRANPSTTPGLVVGSAPNEPGLEPDRVLSFWHSGELEEFFPALEFLEGEVRALASFGPPGAVAVYAGGTFRLAPGGPTVGLARLGTDGWDAIPGAPSGSVRALAVHDEGLGPRLYVGGSFSLGVSSPNLVSFDGAQWHGVGSGLNGAVEGLLSVPKSFFTPPATKDQLYVCGNFQGSPGTGGNKPRRLARWDGSVWSGFGGGMSPNGTVRALALLTSGAGSHVYFGGDFTSVGGSVQAALARIPNNLASNFQAETSFAAPINGGVRALAVHNLAGGAALVVGGQFTEASSSATNIAVLAGGVWLPVPPLGGSVDRVDALVVHNEGSGERLYAAGTFVASGATALHRVARLEEVVPGSLTWAPLGAGLAADGRTLHSHLGLGASGPALFVGTGTTSDTAGVVAWGNPPPGGPGSQPWAAIPGCDPKTATLLATSGGFQAGTAEQLTTVSFTDAGLGLLYVGVASTSGGGCGLQLSGIGEWLLALAPPPLLLASAATSNGITPFALTAPLTPGLIGQEFTFQVVQVDTGVGPIGLSLTNALRVRLFP